MKNKAMSIIFLSLSFVAIECGESRSSSPAKLYDGPCEDGFGSGTSIVYSSTWGPMIEGKTSASVGFEFDCDGGPCLCGMFADRRSFWVAPPPGSTGIVDINGFSPQRCSECTEASGTGVDLRDGWLDTPTGDVSQYRGMDGRLGSVGQPEPLVPTHDNPYSIDTTRDGYVARMIVKGDSNLDTGVDCRDADASPERPTTRMCLEYFNAVAVLARAPENDGATVLRPAIYGGDATQKKLISTSQIDLSILPAMKIEARPSTGAPVGQGWDASLEALTEPKMEWFFDWPGTEVGTAGRNSSTSVETVENGYGPTKHRSVNEALLWLTFDDSQFGGTQEKKQLLAIRAVQLGMDICGAIVYGGSEDEAPGEFGSWPANGGHNVGRYARPVVAAAMLDDTPCLEAITMSADNHRKSYCQGGENDGERCGDHWGVPTCGSGSCVVSTNPADICDEHLSMFAETGQQQQANTHGASGAGIALYGSWNNLVRPATPAGSNPIHADDEAWIDGGSSADNLCPGNYQSISWPAFQVEFSVLKAMPATWPYVNPTFFEYMDRMHTTGTHCAPDSRDDPHGGDQSANGHQVTQLCLGGVDAQRPCLFDADCAQGTCAAKGPLHTRPSTNYVSPSYNSLQGLYQYEANRSCYADCSCTGMEGLCN